jgi:hypothetical protein
MQEGLYSYKTLCDFNAKVSCKITRSSVILGAGGFCIITKCFVILDAGVFAKVASVIIIALLRRI